MKALLIVLALSCPTVKIINTTKYPINERDRQIVKQCQRRCSQIYPDSPCLKRFEKYGEHDYNCICGN